MPTIAPAPTLADRLIGTRTSRGLTLGAAAREIGISDCLLSRYERGHLSNPRASTIRLFAAWLRVEPGELLR